MPTVNIHEAKTHLSRLLERVAAGETVIIARAGEPIAKVAPLDAPVAPRRLGFLAGELRVPRDFDRMGGEEIAALFGDAG
ncbi:MAG: type II toxin-antitoxin system prevent-host-death family antitoxin [Gemmatimonadaceae bacterium]|jgi:prevent-host-death family protein|nr:type II toxin-antitoxin system prevent-host-death family antitoxin [Gemmatimonadaceae bacterium]